MSSTANPSSSSAVAVASSSSSAASSREFTVEDLHQLLQSTPSVKADYQLLLIKLKRRQLTGSQQCIRATLEIIRSLLGRFNFSSTDHMMKAVKAAGRELSAAAQTELTIGNLVRRVLFLIREEHAAFTKAALEEPTAQPSPQQTQPQLKPRSASKDLSKTVGVAGGVGKGSRRDRSNSVNSNTSATEEEEGVKAGGGGEGGRGGGGGGIRPSTSSTALEAGGILSYSNGDGEDYNRFFPEMRASVIKEINEINNEIDNYAAICQRALDYVHVDECILTYGYSRVVELFLKTVGAKRRFQLIVAEGAPGLDGHKLAHSLCKIPNISVTIIPDSNLYAIMARVNKVILSPHAIMADGGAISSSGHLMVAAAAKEFLVPVVCISGAFSLTPLFAHNQTLALQQLQSPASTLPYNADVNFLNVEVVSPAFDYITPDLVSLYVTNDGSQLPSYMFRLLSEHYHPKDYTL